MTEWQIKPLCFGEFPTLEQSAFTYMRGFGEKFSAPSIGFLLVSELATVLIDSGPGDQSGDSGLHSPWTRTPEQDPATAMRAAGLDPIDLDLVVLSHLHYDHSSNLEVFPNAKLVVQAAELRSAVDPIRPQRGIYEFGHDGFAPPWMSQTHRLQVVRGDTELLPGIELLLLPGHTPGMMGVRVRTAGGHFIIASDLVSVQENWGSGGPDDWISPGIHVDLEACERSFERLLAVGGQVLASHDWRTLEHDVYPVQ